MQACCTARDGDVLRFTHRTATAILLTREDIRRADIGDRAPKFNPTTGPVYIEGANPVTRSPSRSWTSCPARAAPCA